MKFGFYPNTSYTLAGAADIRWTACELATDTARADRGLGFGFRERSDTLKGFRWYIYHTLKLTMRNVGKNYATQNQ